MVRLNGKDLYNVQFGYLRKGKFEARKDIETFDDVFCDELANIIDDHVERVKEYVR